MSAEFPNSVPQGDPRMAEDVVPVSPVPSDPDSRPEPIGEPAPTPNPEGDPERHPDPQRDPGREPQPVPEPDAPGGPHAPIEVASQSSTIPPSVPPRRQPGKELWSLLVAAAAWFIPGAGYLLQRRWARAVVGFAAVAALAVIGLKMRGNIFPPHGTEPFDFLGFIADAGSGIFYFFAKNVEAAGPDVSRAAGDYGTRLFATAGILNFLLVLDSVEIARGEKS